MEKQGSWRAVRELGSLVRAATVASPDGPGWARSDNRSEALFERARTLAVSDLGDQAARDELRRLAGRRRKTLVRAEKLSRLGGMHRERSRDNRAFRLLYAALHDEPVAAASDEDLSRIAILEKVFAQQRSDGEIWEELCAAEPRLRTLEDQAKSGWFGTEVPLSEPTEQQRADPEHMRALAEGSRGRLGLHAEVKRVVGPRSVHRDTVLASHSAMEFTLRRFQTRRPNLDTQQEPSPHDL